MIVVHDKNKHGKRSRFSRTLVLTGTFIVGFMLIREQSLPVQSVRSRVQHITTEEHYKSASSPLQRLQPSALTEADIKGSIVEKHNSYEHSDASDPSQSAALLQHRPLRSIDSGIQRDIVKEYDFIYEQRVGSWDSAPIVIESHKLIFFTIPKVGCTVWKQLFRRMMKYDDWASQDYQKLMPHNPLENGLKYLYNYSLEDASVMMTSPDWTRAIMVRDPKIRFLSAFIDKAVENDSKHIEKSCCPDRSCIEDALTLPGFINLCHTCKDDHWHPQNERVDEKYWPYMDYILHLENAEEDAPRLLKAVGAWEEYGAKGWGKDGQLSIFQNKEVDGAGEHARYAEWRVWQYYTPESEKLVEELYSKDYENSLFNFTSGTCLTCIGDN